MYYCVDARSGRILWSYVGEDSYPELRASWVIIELKGMCEN